MYYYVVFGEGAGFHTKAYLYASTQPYEPGMLVMVPSNQEQRVAMIRSAAETVPESHTPDPQCIKEILRPYREVLRASKIRSFLLSMIDDYKDGGISREAFDALLDCFLHANHLDCGGDPDLLRIMQRELPLICQSYVRAPGDAREKEIGFWKNLKALERRLRCGTGSERPVFRNRCRFKTDPVELTDDYLAIELELERAIRAEIGEPGYKGYCHRYWSAKKRILRETYHIDWKSPAELNPGVCYD